MVFGDQARNVVKVGQELGFLGAMIAGLGGLLVGVSILRHHRRRAGVAPWLLLLTLPLGFLAIALLATMGVDEDYLGLPLTMLYGGAWITFGVRWIRRQDEYAAPVNRCNFQGGRRRTRPRRVVVPPVSRSGGDGWRRVGGEPGK